MSSINEINYLQIFLRCDYSKISYPVSDAFLVPQDLVKLHELYTKLTSHLWPESTLFIAMMNDKFPMHKIPKKANLETRYLKKVMQRTARKIYRDNSDYCINPSDFQNAFGSLWHRGFIFDLFEPESLTEVTQIEKWIDEIGRQYDPLKIKNLVSDQDFKSIYTKGFSPYDVYAICKYCFTMFHVNMDDVAVLFELKNLGTIKTEYTNTDDDHAATLIAINARIYAEKNNIVEAKKYFLTAIELASSLKLKDDFFEDWYKFKKFIRKYDTSFLVTKNLSKINLN